MVEGRGSGANSPRTTVACGQDRPQDAAPGLLTVLRDDLGYPVDNGTGQATSCDLETWAAWGLLAPTSHPDEPLDLPTGPWATRIAHVIDTLAELTTSLGAPVEVEATALLTARAREAGWKRRGVESLNGSARLLPAVDGWVAVNLARAGDRDVLPAVTASPVPVGAEWVELEKWTSTSDADGAASALQRLGVPASVVGGQAATAALRVRRLGQGGASRRSPLVIDLSAMWAGPLAAHLLHRAGATVITVEDPSRPDGARGGPPQFYESLHGGREHRFIDLRGEFGREELIQLVGSADMVIEASRPRALRQLGLVAEDFVAARPGRTWISITGYGREAFDGMRVAFGDDVAAAGGLVGRASDGTPVFVADAVADPLSGLWAATAAAASWAAGGGHLLDLSMAGVAAEVSAATSGATYAHRVSLDANGGWYVVHEAGEVTSC